jgi:hypothetical protein
VRRLSAEAFRSMLENLGEVADLTRKALGPRLLPGDEAELQFGVSVDGGADLRIVSTKMSASFDVTIRWKEGA